jgi:hypothetical protein
VILTDPPTLWNSNHTNPPGGLANYYRNNVIGGPGAFVMVAENSNSFGDIIGTSGERADAPKGSSSRRSNTNPTNEFVRQYRQLIRVVLSPAVFDRDIQPHPEQGFRTCLGILRLYRGIVGFGAS